jgi:hypothetical protein
VTLTPAPAVQDRDRLRAHQLPFQLARSARLADLLRGHWQSRHCTTSAMSPSVKTPPRSAPAPLATSWPACATWPSGCSVGQGRSTSPPRYAATPATHTDLWPRSGSASDETDVTTERQSPAVTYATNQAATKSTGPPKQPTAIFVLDEIAVTALITAQAHPAASPTGSAGDRASRRCIKDTSCAGERGWPVPAVDLSKASASAR